MMRDRISTPGWIMGILVAGLLTVGVGFLFLNQLVPLFADDHCRASESFSIVRVVHAAYNTYFSWSGRFPVMFFNFLFHADGHRLVGVFEIMNALALCAACVLALRLAPQSPSFWHGFGLAMTFLFLFWFVPDFFGEAVLWKTGAVQYFWGLLLAAACLLPVLRAAVYGEIYAPGRLIAGVFLFAAFLGGAWLENVSVAVAAVWAAALAYIHFGQRRTVPKVLSVGLVLWVTGAVLLIAAPGNYVRVAAIEAHMPLYAKLLPLSERLFHHLDTKLLLFFIGFVVIAVALGTASLRRQLVMSGIWFSLALLSAYAMMGAPNIVFDGRTKFPTEFFQILAVVSVFPHLDGRHDADRWQRPAAVLLAVMAIGMLSLVTRDYRTVTLRYADVSRQNDARLAQARSERARGIDEHLVPPLDFGGGWSTWRGDVNRGRIFARDIRPDAGHWANACFAKAHRLKRVRLALPEER